MKKKFSPSSAKNKKLFPHKSQQQRRRRRKNLNKERRK